MLMSTTCAVPTACENCLCVRSCCGGGGGTEALTEWRRAAAFHAQEARSPVARGAQRAVVRGRRARALCELLCDGRSALHVDDGWVEQHVHAARAARPGAADITQDAGFARSSAPTRPRPRTGRWNRLEHRRGLRSCHRSSLLRQQLEGTRARSRA